MKATIPVSSIIKICDTALAELEPLSVKYHAVAERVLDRREHEVKKLELLRKAGRAAIEARYYLTKNDSYENSRIYTDAISHNFITTTPDEGIFNLDLFSKSPLAVRDTVLAFKRQAINAEAVELDTADLEKLAWVEHLAVKEVKEAIKRIENCLIDADKSI